MQRTTSLSSSSSFSKAQPPLARAPTASVSTPPPLSPITTAMPATKRLALAACAWCVLATTASFGPLVPVAAAAASSSSSVPQSVQGKARVVDGDTLVINGERIRLYGVDAPESKQSCTDARGKPYACGAVAQQALEARVRAGGGTVRCAPKERDQYGRLVASCSLPPASGGLPFGAEEDMGDYMVRKGQAVSYRKITPLYVPAEDAARRGKVGIWAGDFTPPAKWRYERRVAEGGDGSGEVGPSSSFSPSSSSKGFAAPAAAASSNNGNKAAAAPSKSATTTGCRIKGNISAKGEKIYHVPTDVTYGATKIDEKAGERYFCSEEEAEKAGWRASRAPSVAPTFTSGAGGRWR